MIAAAVVPHPPLLVPALASGAAAEVAPLLQACDTAVAELVGQAPGVLVCVGGGPRTRPHPARAWGTLAGFGVAVRAPARLGVDGDEPDRPTLPLSLTIGRWLLERSGWTGRTVLHEIAVTATPGQCAALGRRLVEDAGPDAGWLVLGDGSASRSALAPGYLHPGAEGFDAAVAEALAAGDAAALARLDPRLAAELAAAGRAPWQVLAGAVNRPFWRSGGTGSTVLHYDGAPYGVGYIVAGWRPG